MQQKHPRIVTFIFLQGSVSHSVSPDISFSLAEDTDVKSRAGRIDLQSIRVLDHSGLGTGRYGSGI